MQRRVVVLYAVFFSVIATGAFALLATTAQSVATMESPEHTLAAGTTFSVDDR